MKDERYNLIHGDCLEVMKTLPDKSVDLCLTDPPYGIAICRSSNQFGTSTENSRKATSDSWDDFMPTKEYFDEIFRVSKNQIIFGANYFWENFYSSQCYVVWDKRGDLPDVPFADTEFAWTSFVNKSCKRYQVINHGFIRDSKEPRTCHPTQKPLLLMQKILADFSKANDLILDCFMGSGTTGVASMIESRRFIGIEKDEYYYHLSEARIKRALGQGVDIPQRITTDKVLPLFATV